MKDKRYIFLSAGVLVLILALVYFFVTNSPWNPFGAKSFGQLPQVTKTSDKAFGTLMLGAQNAGSVARDAAATGASMPVALPSPIPPSAGGGSAEIARPYYGYTYNYKYTGTPFTQTDAQLGVLKRLKDTIDAGQATSFLSQLNFNLANLSSFSSAKLQNFSLTQDQEYGYSFYVDVSEGAMSISQNWLKWPNSNTRCEGAADQAVCYQQSQLTVNDVLSDAAAIEIANKFLSDHGIANAGYGAPLIENDWRVAYDSVDAVQKMYYIPESISVVYPLQFDGKEIYEQGGSKSGLRVEVSNREKKVVSLYGLQANVYQSSLYDAETDANTIIAIAEKGGYGNYGYPMPLGASKSITPMMASEGVATPSVTTSVPVDAPMPIRPPMPDGEGTPVTLELDTPIVAYMHMWSYNYTLGGNSNGEYLIPSMIFPIKNPPKEAYYGSKYIIVPLIKDVLNTINPGVGQKDSMPPSAGGGTSGSMPAPDMAPVTR